jgi:tetratricopeptide (TPR) repeat protein
MLKFIIIILFSYSSIYSEKVLVYDEDKGIIFVDKDSLAAKEKKKKKKQSSNKKKSSFFPVAKEKSVYNNTPDIHLDRKKDPPELYFKSGIEYYKNEDYENSLKNFKYAYEKDVKPEYLLWIGKAYRQLNESDQMFKMMKKIVKKYPESEVADDALFEMAFSYQKKNNYHNAIETYRRVIEQYPFGVSYSNGVKFIEIARKQIRIMRGEIKSALTLLGYTEDNLEDVYSKFQTINKIPVTGKGDSETIRTIKKMYTEKLDENERNKEAIYRFHYDNQWLFMAGFVLFIIILINFSIWMKINYNQKQLSMARDLFTDLK